MLNEQKIKDYIEELEDTNLALKGVNMLLAESRDNATIKADLLYYVLSPIIDKQDLSIKELYKIAYQK
jgi:CRISPR/Cas system CSM-associated protein Csm2 small subunit